MSTAERLSVCEMFQRTVLRMGDAPALRAAGRDSVTWRQYGDRVRAVASGLLSVGVVAGESVALLTSNTPEFHIVDTAIMHIGAVPFSLHGEDPVESLVDRVRVAHSPVIVTEEENLSQARAVAASVAEVKTIVVVGEGARGDAEITLAEVEGRPQLDAEEFMQLWRAVTPEDVATLIFTSGTTGRPKAVQLPHRAITVSLQTFLRLAPGGEDGRVLSYLPLTHIAERFMSHYLAIGYGAEISCVIDPNDLYDEIARVHPTRFFGVPRVYDKLADRARAILTERPDAPVAAELGLDQAFYRGVATAPSSSQTLDFFAGLGMPVGDIWGMSEAIMCTTNPAMRIKIGTVGRLLDEVQARVAADGELMVRGPNTFVGYLGEPARTAEIFDADGWIHTGDIGRIDDEGYLTIIGRKKEIIITATGKNVVPSVVEQAISDGSPLIDQVVAIGEGRRYIIALIALDAAQLATWARQHGRSGTFAELVSDPAVLAEVGRAVDRANTVLERAETVRSWYVTDTQWLPGGDELTPTMKLRRSEIYRKYAAAIDSLYATDRPVSVGN